MGEIVKVGFGEQLVTLSRPFVITTDGRVVTGALVDLDETLRENAARLGCTVKMLCRLLDAEKAWRRGRARDAVVE